MFSTNRYRKHSGQGLIEVITGAMVIVPIALFGLDIVAMGLSNSVNDHLAKEAARAAANQKSAVLARLAAENAVKRAARNAIIIGINMDSFDYKANDRVSVKMKIDVRLPAPFPGFAQRQFLAQDVEPIVANAADI